jgi:hypothetical protein
VRDLSVLVSGRACSRVAAAQFVLLIFGSDLIYSVLCYAVDESLQGDVGIPLESPHQKTRVLLVLIALLRCFPEHARKAFGEISVRT